MKKSAFLSLSLCMMIAIQSILLPVQAATVEEPTLPTGAVYEAPAKTPFGQVCVQEGCRSIEGMVPLGGSEPKLESAVGVFLFERNTETVIYSYGADLKLPPGNLTKIVTGIVALQFCKMDDTVTVVEGIKGRLPVSTLTMGLTNNEVVTVRDLIHALILTDANDAAVALAEHITGNRQGFVPLMNQWVKDIGCTGTEFATVHGVDGAASYTTARDMTKIVREALKNPDFAEAFCAAEYVVPATNVNEKTRTLKTMNYMRDTGVIAQFYDQRITGGIASYETTSGACLVVTAESKNMDLIGVVLGCKRQFKENGWQPSIYGNFEEMAELLKFGFNNYKVNRIVYDDIAMNQFTVANGESNAVGKAKVNIDSVVPINAQMKNLTMNYNLEGTLTAPIKAGQKLGTVELWYRNSCLAEAEVFAMGDVVPASSTGVVIHSTAEMVSSGSKFWNVVGTIVVIALGLAAAYLGFNAYMRASRRARHRRRRQERRRTR